jgi:hypothetical protein
MADRLTALRLPSDEELGETTRAAATLLYELSTPPAAEDRRAALRQLVELVEEWRAMTEAAFKAGAIPGDDGHSARWHGVEFCADQLAALLADRGVSAPQEKE